MKKLWGIFLILALVFCFAACAKIDTPDTNDDQNISDQADLEELTQTDSEPKEINLNELKQKYPEYFDLTSDKGLEVYVWEIAEDLYSYGLMVGTNRLKTTEELLNLKGTTKEEMLAIISTYNLDSSMISVIRRDSILDSTKMQHSAYSVNISELRQKYPEYFDLPTDKGLEVYVWQWSKNLYSYALMSGTNRTKTTEELLKLRGTTAEEMFAIISTYDIDGSLISLNRWQHPLSNYMMPFYSLSLSGEIGVSGSIGYPSAYTVNLSELRQEYPEYFDLPTDKGLKVYVWQMTENSYSYGLTSGTNSVKTMDELVKLKAVSAAELMAIISTYDLDNSMISVIKFNHPASSYMD